MTSAEAFLSLLRHQGEIWGGVDAGEVEGGGLGFTKRTQDPAYLLFTTNHPR